MHGWAVRSCALNAGIIAVGFRVGAGRRVPVSTAYDAGTNHGVSVT
ncbi:hypothetical protein [Pseudarthrobacter chlorophenolicus]|nr:hypothetical protein [Pseudarthrobacter chlorophenolicus]